MKKIILLILMSFMSSLGFSQLNEDFETAPALPNATTGIWTIGGVDWLVRDNRTNGIPNWQENVPKIPFPAHSGTKAAFINRENGAGAGVLTEEWLITPQQTITANQQLRFYTRQTFSGNDGSIYQIRISSNPDQANLAAYTVLTEYTEIQLSTITPDQLDYEEKIINLTGITGARYIAFVKVNTQLDNNTSGDRWLVDDVKIITRCIEPTGLNIDPAELTTTSATLQWISTAANFTVEYGQAGFIPGQTPSNGTVVEVPNNGNPNEYAIPEGTLIAGTDYQFYVTAHCGTGPDAPSSALTGPFNFSTKPLGSTCDGPIVIPVPLSYSTTDNTLQHGNSINPTTPGNGCGVVGTQNYFGGNDVVYAYTVPATPSGIISITMDPQGNTNTSVFVYASCDDIGENCIAGVANTNASIRTIPLLDVSGYVGQTIYIVLSSTEDTGDYPYTLTLQDVNCAPPVLSGLSAVSNSPTTADLSWQNLTGTTSWEVFVQPTGAGIPSTAGTTTTDNTNFTVNALTNGTPFVAGGCYQFWVRSQCPDSTFSQWTGPYQFCTSVCPNGGCNYTFVLTDSFGDGWGGNTMNVIQGGVTIATIGSQFTGGFGPINVSVPLCNGPFSLFWNTGGNDPGEVRVAIQNSFSQTIYAMTTSSTALRGTTLYSGTVDCSTPACLAPTNLTFSNVLTYGVKLEWTPNGPIPESWDIYVVAAGSPVPVIGTTPVSYNVPGVQNPFIIPNTTGNLLPDTTYTYYVVAHCSSTSASTLSPVSGSFTTLPTCPKPINLTVTSPDMNSVMLNWTPQGTETAWEYTYVAPGAPLTGATWYPSTTFTNVLVEGLATGTPYDFYVRAICTAGVEISSPAGPTAGNTTICLAADQCAYTFTMTDSWGDGWNGALMQVRQNGIVVATIGGTFTGGLGPVVATVPLCNNLPFDLFWSNGGGFANEVRISITNGFGQTLYAMTTASGNLAGTVLYTGTVDCDNPACLPPTNLTASAPTTYGATLTWVQNGTVAPASWDIYVVPVGSPAPVAGTPATYNVPDTAAIPPYTIPNVIGNLLPDTQYVFYVRSVCATPGANDWSAVSTPFTTLPTCPKPINLTVTSPDMNSVMLTWTPQGTETAWEYTYVAPGAPLTGATWYPSTTFTNVLVEGLATGTPYDFYVRAVCTPGTDISTPTGPAVGNTTICAAADQCLYTFTMTDSYGDGWNGALMQVRQNGIVVATIGGTFTGGLGPVVATVPLCNNLPFDLFWSNGGGFANEVRVSITNGFSQTLYAMTTASGNLAGTVLYTGTVDCDNPACLPPTNLTASAPTTYGATLTWVQNGTVAPASWDIYVVPVGSPAPVAGTPATYNVPDTAAIPPYTIPNVIGNLLPDTQYVFYVRSVCATPGANDWSVVSPPFTTLPTCPKPINLTVTPDMTSVTLNWTPAGTETAWEFTYVPAGDPAPTNASTWYPSATSVNVPVPGLTSSTCYDFYVRAICTPGIDISTITGPTNACTTICPAADQCLYTFIMTDSYGDGWNGARMQVRQNGIVLATIGETFTGGLGPIAITVPICPNIPMDLFWNTAGGFPGEVRVAIQNSFSQTIYAMTASSPGLVGTAIFSSASPSCTVPECQTPTAVGAEPNTNYAQLIWNYIPGVTYDIYVVPFGTAAPVAGTTPTYAGVTTHPFTTDLNLTALTQYTFYVRMHCPSGTGNSAWSTGFDFTTLPTCPQPVIVGSSTTTTSADITWTEIGLATSWEVWVVPAGSPVPVPGTGNIVTQNPLVNPITYNTLTGPGGGVLFPGLYNFYVRALCSDTDTSAITGPHAFFILNVDPICADVLPQNPNINEEGIINICPENLCVDLSATFTENNDTSTYEVLPIPFAPPFPFDGGEQLDIDIDDIWGPVFPLPFNFCFFGTNYPAVQVGSNGVLSFTTTYAPGVAGGCLWNTDPGTTVPDPAFPIRNAIYGVYQDINPNVDTPVLHTINYQILGTEPCRTFVLNFVNVAQFSCELEEDLQTSQIVLYETSNIIEVYVKDRTSCTSWNEGSGVIGIQNAAGTAGYTPPNRNLGTWETHNEAWKFRPSGESNVTFSWLKDGEPYSDQTDISVCVTNDTTVMTAQAVYSGCGGTIVTKTSDVTIQVNRIDVLPVEDVTSCDCYTLPELPVNQHYFTEAGGLGEEIPALTVICDSRIVYVYGATDTTPACTDEENFSITITPAVAPVSADVTQCDPYTLPNLNNPDFNYYSGPDGGLPMYSGLGGDIISEPTTLYIYGGVGACTAESSFEVTVGDIIAETLNDVVDCTGYTLPELPANNTYYDATGGPDGGGNVIPATTVISADGTQTVYIWAQVGDCTDESSFTITIDDEIIPQFTQIADICEGTTDLPILPLSSNDNPSITGTWSPAVVDATTTTTYTFTPDGTIPCAVPVDMTITVIPQVTPTFDAIPELCLNTTNVPVLPLTSTNDVSGTWSPSAIVVDTEGTFPYTFTPDAGECAEPLTINVTVNASITALFTQIGPLCQNIAQVTLLPETSENGITGSWVPSTITASGDYVFTPDASQECALGITMSIVVNPVVTPDFDIQTVVCAGSVAPLLPTTSPNGVNGTWNPAIVSNTTSGVYTFTPNTGECATTMVINVEVLDANRNPDFAEIAPFCANTTAPVLATTSPSTGISGTWSPATISNTASGTYTFTPNAGQCAIPQVLNVTVLPDVTLMFDPIPTTLCSENAAPTLPATDLNGETGTWSPATVSNTVDGTYTFTPDAPCAVPYVVSVNVIDLPEFTLQGGCIGNDYVIATNSEFTGATYVWTDANGAVIPNANGPSLTVTTTGMYNLSITADGCPFDQDIMVTTVSCGIQRGISPGDGSDNDFFDLAGLNVRKLEIFNRYGTKVYSRDNYSKEWYGQSDKGDELPDGTYYYVIERDNVPTKTGWIYINRVN